MGLPRPSSNSGFAQERMDDSAAQATVARLAPLATHPELLDGLAALAQLIGPSASVAASNLSKSLKIYAI